MFSTQLYGKGLHVHVPVESLIAGKSQKTWIISVRKTNIQEKKMLCHGRGNQYQECLTKQVSPCLLDMQQDSRSKQECGPREPLLHQLPNHIENKPIEVLSVCASKKN